MQKCSLHIIFIKFYKINKVASKISEITTIKSNNLKRNLFTQFK